MIFSVISIPLVAATYPLWLLMSLYKPFPRNEASL
jgi:hypothetical protein